MVCATRYYYLVPVLRFTKLALPPPPPCASLLFGKPASIRPLVAMSEDREVADTRRRPSLGLTCYEDRQDHFKALMKQSRMSLPRIDVDVREVRDSDDDIIEEEDGEAVPEEEARYQRIRHLLEGRTVEVEVRLRDFSYHVPVKTDTPSVKTVMNQSPCYGTYEFGRRFVEKCCNRRAITRLPTTAVDVFLPFEKEAVLVGINLVLKPGKTYVILGPPASGKTSLLKAIAGRLPNHVNVVSRHPVKDKPHISGRVEYNDVTVDDDPEMVLANVVSYVGQLDCHAPYLTVAETFEFALRSRTGKTNEINGDADATENLTIEGLGLEVCKDTFVGNDDVRGISGGQRRRVTVGEMMQGQSPVACADEISTGLDAAVTYDIIHSIVAYSRVARTTRVVSLLQPGPETFSLFDEVILLAKGYVVYAGPIANVVEYFAGLGYKQPPTMDVADFLQLIPTPDGAMLFDAVISPVSEHYSAEGLADAFKESAQYEQILLELDAPNPSSWKLKSNCNGDAENGHTFLSLQGRTKNSVPAAMKVAYQKSLFGSTMLNLFRHFTLWKRDKGFIIGKACENIGMAVATGGILFGAGNITWDQSTPLSDLNEADSQAFAKLAAGVYGALFMTTFHILLGEQQQFHLSRVHQCVS